MVRLAIALLFIGGSLDALIHRVLLRYNIEYR